MQTKLLEIRDRATFIPVLAIQCLPGNEEERYLLSRAGYGVTCAEQERYILLAQIDGSKGKITYDL